MRRFAAIVTALVLSMSVCGVASAKTEEHDCYKHKKTIRTGEYYYVPKNA